MNDAGLNNCINSPTRIGPVRITILDLILTRECSVLNPEVIDVDRTISVHNGVLINIKTDCFKKSYKREIWDYHNGVFDKVNQDINNVNWEDAIADTDVEQACEFFYHYFY